MKTRLLNEAEQECTQLIALTGKDELTLFDLGWIYDERGDYERAVTFYREAQERDVSGRYPNITYNLACTYSKWGRYAEALDELQKVIGRDENWEDVARDSDFESLRNHPDFAPRFARIVEEARARQ